jgi:hypothetical protein
MNPYEVCLSNCAILPYEPAAQELSTNTLSQFLIENEGKRCVVILDVRNLRLMTSMKTTDKWACRR